MDAQEPVLGKRTLKSAIREHTFHIPFERRYRIRTSARLAKWSNCQRGAFSALDPYHYPDGFDQAFIENSRIFGMHLADTGAYGKEMRKRLKDVLHYSNPLPFLVLRRLLPRYELPWTHAGESAWFIRKGIYNLVCSGLISLTGSILHRKNEGTPPWKDFRTSFHMQKNAKSDGYDMPLRYRQATPERRFPHDLNVRRQDDLSASVVVFACIENPIRDPIWLLPVSEVIKRLSDDNLKLLSDNKFEFFDNWTENWISEHAIRDQSVIEWVGPPDNRVCLLSYDMNRLNSLYAPTDSHYKEALGKLDHAIEVAGCDENSGAIPIVLTPGDVLVLDNARMMYARKEMPYASFRRLMVGRPAERYLRAYYGFPDAREILKRRSAGGEYPADRGLRMI